MEKKFILITPSHFLQKLKPLPLHLDVNSFSSPERQNCTLKKNKIIFLYLACECKGDCPGSREVFIVTQHSICTDCALQWWCQTAGRDLAWRAQGGAGGSSRFDLAAWVTFCLAEGALGVAGSAQCCFWCLICFCSRWEGFYSCLTAFATDGEIRDFVSANSSLKESLVSDRLNSTWSVQNLWHALISTTQPAVNKELQMLETLSYFLTSVIFIGPHRIIAFRWAVCISWELWEEPMGICKDGASSMVERETPALFGRNS